MDNFLSSGDVIAPVAPEGGVTAGVPVLIGGLFVVPRVSADAGDIFPGVADGVIRLPKATGFAPSAGAVAYWDEADEELNSDTTNPSIGHYERAALTGDTDARIRLIDTPLATVSALDARLDEAEKLCQTMPAAGTQVVMVADDTYVNMTADLLAWEASLIEAGNVIEFQKVFKVDDMDAAGATTFSELLGSLELATVVVSTADANDYAEIKGTITFKAVGASSTVDISVTTIGSDGGTETAAYTHTFAATGPATTSAVQLKSRAKTATGHADNKVTQRIGWGRLVKKTA